MLGKTIVDTTLLLSARSVRVVRTGRRLLLLLMLAFWTCMLIRLIYYPSLHTPYISAIDSRLLSRTLACGLMVSFGWTVSLYEGTDIARY